MVSNNENRWSQIHLNPVQHLSEFGALKTQQAPPTKGSGGLPSTLGVNRSALWRSARHLISAGRPVDGDGSLFASWGFMLDLKGMFNDRRIAPSCDLVDEGAFDMAR